MAEPQPSKLVMRVRFPSPAPTRNPRSAPGLRDAAGCGTDVDLDVIRAWWSLRSLQAARWLIEHGFDPSSPGAEFDVLRSQL
jgi:hypothetical protein